MLDRTLTPDFKKISSIPFIPQETISLDNGIPLHLIRAGEQEVFRLEIIFPRGSFYEKKTGVASFAYKMMSEGTLRHTTHEISEYVDQYGAFLEINAGLDRSTITLFALTKYFEKMLVLLKELVEEAVFPEKELDTLKNISIQNLKVNQQKNDFIASQKYKQTLFGESHPYGKTLAEEVINGISRDDLTAFYQENIQNQAVEFMLSGYFSNQETNLINQFFGQKKLIDDKVSTPVFSFSQSLEKNIFIEQQESVQSSIRIGKLLFQRKHPDYFKLLLTNEIFGGYFGSRLMKNIREEKGYTYGIYSQISNLQEISYLTIATDVKKEFTLQTIEEIHKEVQKMRTELVPEEELDTVKNYLLGSLAGLFNTAFDLADRFKNIYFYDLGEDYYQNYLQKIQQITAEEVMATAKQYLDIENMLEVVVGGK